MLLLALVIFLLILVFAYILDLRNLEDCEKAGFWSDRHNPDHVLMASYVTHRQPELPPNKVINKGYNSEYWDCFELQNALGSQNNEVLAKCKKFI